MAKREKPDNEPGLEQTANSRLAESRRQKESYWVLDFKECYFFTAPNRQRQLSSQSSPPESRILDAAELQTSLAMLLCQDFITEVVNTFMPEAQNWCKRGPGQFIPEDAWNKIKDDVAKDDDKIFEAMKASNLYPEIAKAFFPDLAIGTVGLWIERRHTSKPIRVSAIPLREIEASLGPDGEVDDRWAIRFTRNCYVRELLGAEIAAKLPVAVAAKIDKKPSERTEVRWGFWHIYDETGEEKWQSVVMVGDKMVHDAVLVGEGSCPLLIGRFNPSADWVWGLGPMIQGLPDFRQIDELEGQKIENVEMHLTPPITFPDDSFTNIEQGLEPRMAYPIRPGTEGAVKKIYDAPPPDAAIYQHEEMEHRLRKLFFVDFPEQTGDTPPTLGQWLDQMARAQRRIGTPGLPFWQEVPAKIFLRFKYLLEKAGTIKPIEVNGVAVALTPLNPTQRAAEQQDIATAAQYLQMMLQTFPEEARVMIDGGATMKNFAGKMRVAGEKGLIAFRKEDQQKAAAQLIAQLAGVRQKAGAAPPEEAGAPAAA
ncbi:MAG: portal protein [Nitrobacter sp.]